MKRLLREDREEYWAREFADSVSKAAKHSAVENITVTMSAFAKEIKEGYRGIKWYEQ